MDPENEADYVVTIAPKLPEPTSATVTTSTETTLPLSRNGLYGALHSAHYKAPDTEGEIGIWMLKIHKQGASDFKSLELDEIKNLIMLMFFEI